MNTGKALNTYTILSRFLLSDDDSLSNELLDSWTNEVVLKSDYDFENGIIGLGWLLAFLAQKGKLEGDIDDILYDVDDNVYKITIKAVLEDQFDIDELLTLVNYYGQRLEHKEPSRHFYRNFPHFECMKLLLGKLNTYLLSTPLDKKTICIKSDILLKYSYLLKIGFVESLVEKALYKATEELINYFEHWDNKCGFEVDVLLALTKLLYSVTQYRNPFWMEKVGAIYVKVKEETCFRNTTKLTIWDNLLTASQPPVLAINDQRGFIETEEGVRLLFTLYTNVYGVQVTYSDMDK